MTPSVDPIAVQPVNRSASAWRKSPFVALIFLSACSFMQGVIINGLVVSVQTTIERRFRLKSTEVAWLISSFHLIQCIFQPLVAYLGGKGHQPRWIGIGMFIMGVVTFMFGIPHFTTGDYEPVELGTTNLCSESNNATTQCDNDSGLRYYLIYFIAMQMLNGLVNIPLITLGIAYLQQVTSNAPLYQGIFLGSATIGAAAGYAIGGSTLNVPADIIPRFLQYAESIATVGMFIVLPHCVSIDVTSTLWVGAWWIGFLAVGVFTCLISIPVLLLPKVQSENQPKRFSEQAKILSKLPAYFFLATVVSLEYGTFSGMTALLPKYLQTNFYYSAGEASLFLGLLALTGAMLGQIGGGFIVKKFGLDVEGIIKLVFVFSIVNIGFSFLFLLDCPPLRIANHANLSCSNQCECNFDQFEPVCGQDNVTYFSPCFAGCLSNETEDYYNCSCIQSSTNNGSATRGECESPNCTSGAIFVGLFAISLCFHMASLVPTIQGCIKIVEKKEITYIGVGVMWVFIRLLGMFPFPLIYSEFFKSACTIWQTECGDQGVNLVLLGFAYFFQRRHR